MANTNDVAQIAALYIGNHRETYRGLLPDAYFTRLTPDCAAEKWNAYLQSGENVVWVAYEADEFLGFAAGTNDAELENTWYLDSLHIAQSARGKGLGTEFIARMKRHAGERRCTHMSVCIVRGNETARRLYQKLGAEHFSYFEDDFCGTVSHSEKLLWPIGEGREDGSVSFRRKEPPLSAGNRRQTDACAAAEDMVE